MGNYDAAKKALKEVIDSSGKELLPFNEYAKMFNEDQEKFNRESILEINFRNGDTSGYFWYGEGSQYGLIAALCFQNASGDVEAAGVIFSFMMRILNVLMEILVWISPLCVRELLLL